MLRSIFSKKIDLYIISFLASFHISFNWLSFTSLSESKFSQVSWTLLRVLANLITAVVKIISILLISNDFTILLGIIPSSPTTMFDITTTFMFHCFSVLWLTPSICLSFCFLLISLCVLPEWQNPLNDNLFFSYFIIIFIPCEFFTSVDGLSMKFEWQQASSGLLSVFWLILILM